ncbi:MAG: hypothetical protein AAF600_05515 [Bacteroidota bacterium]
MKLDFKNWSDYHHQIYRIYHGIIAFSLIPFFLVFLELEVADIKKERVSTAWIYVVLVILIPTCVLLMWSVWKGKGCSYRNLEDGQLKDKLIEFRRVEIKKYLISELTCILGLLGLWLTAHYLFVIIYFAVLAQFSFLRPSEDRLVRNMRLTKEERKRLHQGNM